MRAVNGLTPCERDGLIMRRATDDELAAQVGRHIGDAHPDLVGKLSRDEILAMAKDELLSMAEQA
jgi:hypothetical protein